MGEGVLVAPMKPWVFAMSRLVKDGQSEQPMGSAQSRFHVKIFQMTLNHSKFNAVYNQINSAHTYNCLLKALQHLKADPALFQATALVGSVPASTVGLGCAQAA